MKVPLAPTGLRELDISEVTRVLKSGNVTMGAEVKNFESKMEKYLNVNHFVMVNSGSSANLLMIEALLRPTKFKPKLAQGDGILVPAIAWPTTVWPLIQLGLNPIFVDVKLENISIDLDHAQQIIDDTGIPIRGIFPIHPLGYAISPSELSEFKIKNDLVNINDVCESLGSWREGVHAGASGIASSFSFYFSHHITTMEGGGIATDDGDFADDLRSMRSHGWSRDRSDSSSWTKSMSVNDSKFLFVSTGYNVRPMEVQAAVGSAQLAELDNFIRIRKNNAGKIGSALNNSSLAILGENNKTDDSFGNFSSWMLAPITILGNNAKSIRRDVINELNQLGIETRPVLTGNFLSQPAIRRITRNSVNPGDFKNATEISDTSFLVSCHHDLTESQVQYLCESLELISKKYA